MSGPHDGLHAYRIAAGDIRRPGVRRFVIAPLSLSLVVIAFTLGVALSYLGEFTAWFESLLPDFLHVLSTLVVPLAYLLGILVSAYLASFLAVLIASPFLGDLVRAVDAIAGYRHNHDPHWLHAAWLGIRREGIKLRYLLPRLIALLLVGLIPVVSPVAPLLWWLFGAWMAAVEFVDMAADARGRPFTDTLGLLRDNRGAALGFGAIAAFTLAIPFLNVLAVPVAVAGGTRLWHRLAPDPR